MNEEGWLSAARPGPMLARLRGCASERRLWLFACACCWRHWRLLTDSRSRQAVEALERFADGRASNKEMTDAARAAHAAGLRARSSRLAAEAAQKTGGKDGWWEREQAIRDAAQREGAAWLAWRMACRDREAMDGAAEFAAEVAATHEEGVPLEVGNRSGSLPPGGGAERRRRLNREAHPPAFTNSWTTRRWPT